MTLTWLIYALLVPIPLADAGDVRYVGFTSRKLQTRLRKHREDALSAGERANSYRARWLRTLYDQGLAPAPVVLESGTWTGVDGDDFVRTWSAAECKWIAHFRDAGARLTNATDGGEGNHGYVPSPETKARTRAALMGHKHRPEAVAKMRLKRISPEQRATISGEKNAHAKLTTADILAIRSAHADGEAGTSLASRYGMSKAQVSEIISRKQWAHVPDQGTYDRSLARRWGKGRKLSDEHRANMSAGMRARRSVAS